MRLHGLNLVSPVHHITGADVTFGKDTTGIVVVQLCDNSSPCATLEDLLPNLICSCCLCLTIAYGHTPMHTVRPLPQCMCESQGQRKNTQTHLLTTLLTVAFDSTTLLPSFDYKREGD